MISPHFPPDSSAGTHRVRLLAPHLAEFGWVPTVLTIDPEGYEGALDHELAALVPASLRVERAKAVSPRISRRFGIGDLGLRSFLGLRAAATRILTEEPYDAVYITIYPAYTALLGPILKRRFHIPFILDYQDPWVSAWGESVGGGKNGSVDIKSRISRRAALMLEPHAIREADAITAVSEKTVSDAVSRVPSVKSTPAFAIPIGGDERDFEILRSSERANSIFDPRDGRFHISYVGTLLPLGVDVLQAFLAGLAMLKRDNTELYSNVRVHFVGTSNERQPGRPERVMQHARDAEVEDVVTEHTMRVDYVDSLATQLQSSALLLLGSTEHHYTASKLYPALLARRPLLALYHRESSVSTILEESGRDSVHLIQFGDDDPPAQYAGEIARALASLVSHSRPEGAAEPGSADEWYSARNLAGVLASVLDKVTRK